MHSTIAILLRSLVKNITFFTSSKDIPFEYGYLSAGNGAFYNAASYSNPGLHFIHWLIIR